MPAGEASGDSRFWRVIDASTGQILGRINHVSNPHNTITSLDGRFVFLEGQEKGPEPADVRHTVALIDTTTNEVIRRIGPFRDVVRPYTVNGSATMLFATLNNFVGFQVADVTTGKVLYTVPVPGVKQPTSMTPETDCHGIALTPDERQVWLCDRVRGGIDVFDVSDLSSGPPRYVGFVRTRQPGRDIDGHSDPNASNDPSNVPGWIAASYDGRYMYPETGEIIDVATQKVIGQLRGRVPDDAGHLIPGPYTHSKFMLEVDFDQGSVSRVSDQFAIGRVR
jgi:DNA-binding beta-propeller fold protein YncE